MRIIVLFCISINLCVQAQNAQKLEGQQECTGTEKLQFVSKINTKDYVLQVNLPQNYEQNTDKTYPVVYMLDGQWDFISIASIYGSLHWDGFVPDLILVGITYGGNSPNYDTLRANDFTPTPLATVGNSGGAAAFTKVFENEIIPLVNKTYRTKEDDRTIVGNSFAGLYGHYVLFNQPGLFSKYVICNPSLWYDDRLPLRYEKKYAESAKKLSARVYMTTGELDPIDLHKEMVQQIESHAYEDFDFRHRVMEDMPHSASKFEGYTRGLMHVFKVKGMETTPELLRACAGTYTMSGVADKVQVVVVDNQLTVLGVDNGKDASLTYLGNNQFSINEQYQIATFDRDEDGKISKVNVTYSNGNSFTLSKVE